MVGESGERGARPQRVPVAQGIDAPVVVPRQVVHQVRGGVALAHPGLVGHLLVAAGEGHGLEGGPAHLRVVRHAVVEDWTHHVVVDAVHDRDHGSDPDPRRRQVVDGDLLHVEQVRDVAVCVRLVRRPVELEVDHLQARLPRLVRELGLEGEADPVGGRLHQGVAHLLRVRTGVEEVGRDGGLASRVLHDHLPPRLERHASRRGSSSPRRRSARGRNPTWFASMKQGLHIMLQRLVRSTVSTAPRP